MAVALLLIAGLLEIIAGETKLGVFVMLMGSISLVLRIVFIRKLKKGIKKD